MFGVLLWCEEESCARERLRPRALVRIVYPISAQKSLLSCEKCVNYRTKIFRFVFTQKFLPQETPQMDAVPPAGLRVKSYSDTTSPLAFITKVVVLPPFEILSIVTISNKYFVFFYQINEICARPVILTRTDAVFQVRSFCASACALPSST